MSVKRVRHPDGHIQKVVHDTSSINPSYPLFTKISWSVNDFLLKAHKPSLRRTSVLALGYYINILYILYILNYVVKLQQLVVGQQRQPDFKSNPTNNYSRHHSFYDDYYRQNDLFIISFHETDHPISANILCHHNLLRVELEKSEIFYGPSSGINADLPPGDSTSVDSLETTHNISVSLRTMSFATAALHTHTARTSDNIFVPVDYC